MYVICTLEKNRNFALPRSTYPRYRPAMPCGRKKDPVKMTAEEELRSLLQWAEQTHLENVVAALRRVLTKLPTGCQNP